PKAAEASPFPSEETTPPVMKIYRAMGLQNTTDGCDSKSLFFRPSTALRGRGASRLEPSLVRAFCARQTRALRALTAHRMLTATGAHVGRSARAEQAYRARRHAAGRAWAASPRAGPRKLAASGGLARGLLRVCQTPTVRVRYGWQAMSAACWCRR